MTAEYKVHGDVAVITMNNPPINGLGYATRVGLTSGRSGVVEVGHGIGPDQQHFAISIKSCKRFRLDDRKGLGGIAFHSRDRTYGIAGRIDPA